MMCVLIIRIILIYLSSAGPASYIDKQKYVACVFYCMFLYLIIPYNHIYIYSIINGSAHGAMVPWIYRSMTLVLLL